MVIVLTLITWDCNITMGGCSSLIFCEVYLRRECCVRETYVILLNLSKFIQNSALSRSFGRIKLWLGERCIFRIQSSLSNCKTFKTEVCENFASTANRRRFKKMFSHVDYCWYGGKLVLSCEIVFLKLRRVSSNVGKVKDKHLYVILMTQLD